MLRKLWIGIFLAVLVATPALSQEGEAEDAGPSNIGWGLHAGYLLGDVMSEASFGEQDQFQVELDDDVVFGGIFWAEMNENWRFEFRGTYMAATVLDAAPFGWDDQLGEPDGPPRTVSGDLFYFDIGFIRYFELGESLRLGVPFGVGWAALYTDEVFSDSVPGRTVGLVQEDGSGGTYYLGAQLVYEMGGNWELFVDTRFKRFHRLTNILERAAKTNEFTVGFMRRF